MNKLRALRIETERFILRDVRHSDLQEWTRIKYADPEMWQFMPRSDLTPKERVEKAYKFFNKVWSHYQVGAWMVIDKRSGQLVGDCYLEPEEESGSGEIEIGYDVGRLYWGQGAATEAARAVVSFTFENTGIERIVGVAMPDNTGSWRVLEKVGFKFEREAYLYDLGVLVYAIERPNLSPGDHFFRLVKEDELSA